MSSRHAVMLVPFAHGLLGGLPALLNYRQGAGQPVDAPVTIIAWPPAAFDEAKTVALHDVLSRLVRNFPGVRVWAPPPSFRNLVSGIPGRRFERAVRAELGSVTELLYPHDSPRSVRRLSRAFPNARRICFGDGFGTVYTASNLSRRLGSPFSRATGPLRALALSLLEPVPPPREPEVASLLIPCELTPGFLRGRELRVPSPTLAREVLLRLGAAIPELGQELQSHAAAGVRHLLLMGDYSEAGLCTERGEEDLYADITGHLPPDAPLLLKPHPGTLKRRLEEVARRLGASRTVHILPERLTGLPIELARPPEGMTVLSLSYASISLRYLYGSPVVHVLDDRRVERYFLASRREWIREMNDLYVEIAARLPHWNGRGLIWRSEAAVR